MNWCRRIDLSPMRLFFVRRQITSPAPNEGTILDSNARGHRPRLQPGRRQAPRIIAKIASGERVGALGGPPVDRHPAAIFTPWARPESCRFLRLDLLHAIMNRFPVVGDWFRHLSVPPGFAAFFQRRGYQLRTRLPRLGGRIDTPELNGFRYAGRLWFRPRAIVTDRPAHQSTQVRLSFV